MKEQLSQETSASTHLKDRFDNFAKKHPALIKNGIKIGGAATMLTSVVAAGAVWERNSIQEVLADNDRTPICHSGNEKNWTIIQPDEHSYKAHLENMGGPGHNHDYFAFDRNGDNKLTKEDCYLATPTPTKVITPVPSLTPELTSTFMPSPTIVFTPTETEVVPSPTSLPTETEAVPSPTSSPTESEKLVCPTPLVEEKPENGKCDICEETARIATNLESQNELLADQNELLEEQNNILEEQNGNNFNNPIINNNTELQQNRFYQKLRDTEKVIVGALIGVGLSITTALSVFAGMAIEKNRKKK